MNFKQLLKEQITLENLELSSDAIISDELVIEENDLTDIGEVLATDVEQETNTHEEITSDISLVENLNNTLENQLENNQASDASLEMYHTAMSVIFLKYNIPYKRNVVSSEDYSVSTISLEKQKGFLSGLKEGAKDVINAIIKKIKEFFKWVKTQFLKLIPSRFKKAKSRLDTALYKAEFADEPELNPKHFYNEGFRVKGASIFFADVVDQEHYFAITDAVYASAHLVEDYVRSSRNVLDNLKESIEYLERDGDDVGFIPTYKTKFIKREEENFVRQVNKFQKESGKIFNVTRLGDGQDFLDFKITSRSEDLGETNDDDVVIFPMDSNVCAKTEELVKRINDSIALITESKWSDDIDRCWERLESLGKDVDVANAERYKEAREITSKYIRVTTSSINASVKALTQFVNALTNWTEASATYWENNKYKYVEK